MTAAPAPENPSWIELTTKFTEAGLPLPPIPAELRARLRTESDWCWSTKPIDGLDMYMFFDLDHEGRRFLIDVLHDRVEDYAAVSHVRSGHQLVRDQLPPGPRPAGRPDAGRLGRRVYGQ